jgi:hypothetical protein
MISPFEQNTWFRRYAWFSVATGFINVHAALFNRHRTMVQSGSKPGKARHIGEEVQL